MIDLRGSGGVDLAFRIRQEGSQERREIRVTVVEDATFQVLPVSRRQPEGPARVKPTIPSRAVQAGKTSTEKIMQFGWASLGGRDGGGFAGW